MGIPTDFYRQHMRGYSEMIETWFEYEVFRTVGQGSQHHDMNDL